MDSVSSFFDQLFVDADTLGKVIVWVQKLPVLFGSLHPIFKIGFGLFAVFLMLKILIHLL